MLRCTIVGVLSSAVLTLSCPAGGGEMRLDGKPTAVAWTSDGRLLAVATNEGKILLVNPDDMRVVETIRCTDSPIHLLAFDAKGETLAVATEEKLIAWEKTSGVWRRSKIFEIPDPVYCSVKRLWFRKDSREVYFHAQVNFAGNPYTWNLTTGKVKVVYIPWKEREIDIALPPAIAADGRFAWIPLIWADGSKGESVCVELATGKVVDRIEHISAGGVLGNKDQTLAVGMPSMLIGGMNCNSTITFWDIGKKEKIDELTGGYTMKAVSSTSNLAVLGHHGVGNRLLLYRPGRSGREWPKQQELKGSIASFSPCGKHLALIDGKTLRCEEVSDLFERGP